MSIWHWLAVGLVGVLMFGGKGRLTNVMGDAAKGIRAFNEGLASETTDRIESAGD